MKRKSKDRFNIYIEGIRFSVEKEREYKKLRTKTNLSDKDSSVRAHVSELKLRAGISKRKTQRARKFRPGVKI